MERILIVTYLAIILVCCLTGCVKHIETPGGTKIDFVTGFDFGAGFNGVDKVDNKRGINPEGK
jgi:hypothetical protein